MERKFHHPEDAVRHHVPDMEQMAYNQMPKAGYSEVKLYHYDGTNIYLWFGKKNGSIFWDACDEPFMIRPVED